MGLGPKLLSYRAAGGKGGFFKGTLSGPFSSSSDGEGGDGGRPKAEKKRKAEEEAKTPASFWSWSKKGENQAAEKEAKIEEPEGVEVSRVELPASGCWWSYALMITHGHGRPFVS